jgi:hypothetical protein
MTVSGTLGTGGSCDRYSSTLFLIFSNSLRGLLFSMLLTYSGNSSSRTYEQQRTRQMHMQFKHTVF